MPVNPDLTESEMKTLAEDIRNDRVFTSGHIPLEHADMTNQVFMDFLWVGVKREAAIEQEGGVGMVYQYLDQAMPSQTVAGLPRFQESFWLTPKQTLALNQYIFKWKSSNTK